MSAVRAVSDLLRASGEWRRFYKECCEAGTLRLRAQAWQFRDELRERGEWFELASVEDALLVIVRKVLPGTPAAKWDAEWAHELCRDALKRLEDGYARLGEGERDALDLSGQEEWEERMLAAGEENDPAAFREALAGWQRAGLEAIEAHRARSVAS